MQRPVAALCWALAGAALLAPRSPAQQPAGGQPGVRVTPLDRVAAVVGTKPILWSEVIEEINSKRAQGLPMPQDSAGATALALATVNELVDQEVLVNVATQYKADVTDDEVARDVEQRFNQIRQRFASEAEFRDALKREGFSSPEEFRRRMRDQAKRYRLQQLGVDSLRAHGRLSAPVQITEAEVTEAFNRSRETLPRRPASVSFRQIVIAPRPNQAARDSARTKAESLRVEIEKGADFAVVAKRESMDPGSRELGGDLGWHRRGGGQVGQPQGQLEGPGPEGRERRVEQVDAGRLQVPRVPVRQPAAGDHAADAGEDRLVSPHREKERRRQDGEGDERGTRRRKPGIPRASRPGALHRAAYPGAALAVGLLRGRSYRVPGFQAGIPSAFAIRRPIRKAAWAWRRPWPPCPAPRGWRAVERRG